MEEKTNKKDSSVMVLIPAGEFLMGSPEGEGDADEHPQHPARLGAYYIDKFEVTNAQFKMFVDETGYMTDAEKGGGGEIQIEKKYTKIASVNWRNPTGDNAGLSGIMNNPVVHMSCKDARAYAEWAGKRLPTEAEWENACRAGTAATWCFGNDEKEFADYAWFDGLSGFNNKTIPVGQKKPNNWGLYDVHGNAWEWCSDWYGADYYKNSPVENPQGPAAGRSNIIRGGSWASNASYSRSAKRYFYHDEIDMNRWFASIGFRCAASIK